MSDELAALRTALTGLSDAEMGAVFDQFASEWAKRTGMSVSETLAFFEADSKESV